MSEQSLFDTVLASTVHDMKNSLSLVLGQLDLISSELEQDTKHKEVVSTLRYETSRINLSLMQLLTLYKLENHQLKVSVVEVELEDFIEDCMCSHYLLAESKNIQLNVDCDEFDIWFFDPDMVSIIINNIIGNSIRYTKSRVDLSVKIRDGGLWIEINDDGEGYPEIMLEDPENFIKRVNYSTGSTGLGLFFSATVARSHQRQNKQGKIILDNNSPWQGGRFQLFLP